jgi:hypothetical protein
MKMSIISDVVEVAYVASVVRGLFDGETYGSAIAGGMVCGAAIAGDSPVAPVVGAVAAWTLLPLTLPLCGAKALYKDGKAVVKWITK